MELNQLTIKQAQEGLAKKKFSSLELTKACLKRIRKVDKKIKAFITVCEKKALDQAKRADRLLAQDKSIIKEKPLIGIPFTMKDIYCTKGIKTTAGSKVLENYIPTFNATAFKRLCDQDAVIIGKTNCDAWGHGISTENSDFYVTHNPWNLEKIPGGSCGGCGAALAAQMSFFSIGGDTGGSIRLPASYCSIVGMKVSYGRVSRYGIIAFASSLDTVGPMTKTVEDCAEVLKVIAGQDSFDATTSSQEVPNYSQSLKKDIKGLKIGLPQEFFSQGINQEVKAIVLEAINHFRKLGAKVKKVDLATTKYSVAAYYLLNPSETSSNLARYDGIRYGNERTSFGDEAKRRIMIGTHALSSGYYDKYYLKAQKTRTLIRSDYERAFKDCDVLVGPVAPTPPFNIGEKVDDPLKMYLTDIYTAAINTVGIPSLALPCGFTKDNLPIGMQIIGPQFSEELILRVGYAYEQATDWHKRRPVL